MLNLLPSSFVLLPEIYLLPGIYPGKAYLTMTQIPILFCASNPTDMTPLNLAEEVRQIEQGLLAAEHGHQFVLQSQWAMRADDLLVAMNRHRPAIVHFAGHGTEAGIYLLRDDGSGAAHLVPTAALQQLFALFRDATRLVVLNSCLSTAQGEAIAEAVECVVGMGAEVDDRAAATFARVFYRALGFGWTVQAAFDQGIVALLAAGLGDVETPEIIPRADVYPDAMRLGVINRPVDIARGNEVVARAVHSTTGQMRAAAATRKQEIATLYRAVAATLEHAVATFQRDEIPHGDCEKMRLFAQEIYQTIADYVGPTKAAAVQNRLHAAHDVEQALLNLNELAHPDRQRRLAELQSAAGYYAAAADLLLGSI